MKEKGPFKFPLSISDRILLCVLCPFVMLVLSVFIVPSFVWRPETILEHVLKVVCLEVLFTLSSFVLLVFLCGLLASSRLENAIQKRATTVVFLLAVVIVANAIAVTLFLFASGG